MLILTRPVGETLRIGDDISLTITQLDRRVNVRIGIDAPKDLTIVREELLLHSQRSATPTPQDQ